MPTTDDQECIHLLDPRTCSACMGKPDPAKDEPAHGYMVQARYPGTCPECEEPIEVGDMLAYDARDHHAWVHDMRCI